MSCSLRIKPILLTVMRATFRALCITTSTPFALAVFRLIVVLFVLCLIVVRLPPGRNPFAVKINNNNKKYMKAVTFLRKVYLLLHIQ
jgi:hypothetical protein